ncbi:MAG: hypothetical protein HC930_02005 [Hydrococcus sp. SU_1_0]|nr:hypothetical protein [Hydrococcus sp. SU_1_0]
MIRALANFICFLTLLALAFATPPLPKTVLFLFRGFLRMLVRRSFFVGFGRSRVAVPFRRVSGLALSGGCCSWSVRASLRSFSGSVVCAVFVSRSAAAAFAWLVLVWSVLRWRFAWRLLCLWCGVGRFCPCRALSRSWGFVPLFFGDRSIVTVKLWHKANALHSVRLAARSIYFGLPKECGEYSTASRSP